MLHFKQGLVCFFLTCFLTYLACKFFDWYEGLGDDYKKENKDDNDSN